MLEGVINVLKPPGMTSSNAVSDVRRICGIKRVGHTGTLDPDAAGVLGICVGRATRLFDLLVDKQKEYICELSLGASTDTQDSSGRVTARTPVHAGAAQVREALSAFQGELMQTAPMYSALKVDGKALYAHARAGSEVAPKVRSVTVYEAEYLEQTGPAQHLLRFVCSKGTYIRTLCQDIGTALGESAHMSFLLRTRAGALTLENAYSIAELAALREAGELDKALLPPDAALPFLPAVYLDPPERERKFIVHGAQIPLAEAQEGLLRLYMDGRFLGVGVAEAGWVHLGISFGEETADGGSGAGNI